MSDINDLKYVFSQPDYYAPVFKKMELSAKHSDPSLAPSYAKINLTKIIRDLHSDLLTVLTNGSVHSYVDYGYYNNNKGMDESRAIYEKWKVE